MPRGNSPTTRILVVDDEALIRWSLTQLLSRAGYEVVEAPTGATALEHFVGKPPDGKPAEVGLVFLDLRLPDVDDLSLFKRIRHISPSCPIVLMTSYGTPEVTDEAVRCGASAVLGKPFDVEDILVLVRRLLGS